MRVKVATIADIPPGAVVERRILARKVAVFNIDGSLKAMEAECKHMRAPLATGKVVDGVVTCDWHGWKYDLESGECLTTKGVSLKQFPVEVEDGNVYVEIETA